MTTNANDHQEHPLPDPFFPSPSNMILDETKTEAEREEDDDFVRKLEAAHEDEEDVVVNDVGVGETAVATATAAAAAHMSPTAQAAPSTNSNMNNLRYVGAPHAEATAGEAAAAASAAAAATAASAAMTTPAEDPLAPHNVFATTPHNNAMNGGGGVPIATAPPPPQQEQEQPQLLPPVGIPFPLAAPPMAFCQAVAKLEGTNDVPLSVAVQPPPPPPAYPPPPQQSHPPQPAEPQQMSHPAIGGGSKNNNVANLNPILPNPSSAAASSSSTRTADQNRYRVGRWTAEEKLIFLHVLRRFGKGKWKKYRPFLPQRSLVQIKSHAQKVLKRQESGEDIFRNLDDTSLTVEDLMAQVAARLSNAPGNNDLLAKSQAAAARRKLLQHPVHPGLNLGNHHPQMMQMHHLMHPSPAPHHPHPLNAHHGHRHIVVGGPPPPPHYAPVPMNGMAPSPLPHNMENQMDGPHGGVGDGAPLAHPPPPQAAVHQPSGELAAAAALSQLAEPLSEPHTEV